MLQSSRIREILGQLQDQHDERFSKTMLLPDQENTLTEV